MAPAIALDLEMDKAELHKLGQQIRQYQEEHGLTFAQLSKKVAGLGTDRTFHRIRTGDLSELDIEKHLVAYRSIVALLEGLGDDEVQNEVLYDDLWAPRQLKRAYLEMLREKSAARCIFLIGPSGRGKSGARQTLINQYGPQLLWVEASQAWNGSPMAFLGSILRAYGEQNFPFSQVQRLDRVIELMNETPRTLLVEEAHHLGRANLNVEVTLINRTPLGIINFAIDTLWKKLETVAFEECRQLTGNRLAEVIRLGREIREDDARKLLARGIAWASGDLLVKPDPDAPLNDAEKALRIVMDKASQFAGLAFVRDVVKRVNKTAEKKPVTIELFTNAVTQEVASR